MKKISFFILILYLFLGILGSVFGIGEKTISLGGESAWSSVEFKTGITEFAGVRIHPVLGLSASGSTISLDAAHSAVFPLDLSLSFNENYPASFRDSRGNYRVSVSPGVEASGSRFSRAGAGAALFPGGMSPQSGAGTGISNGVLIEPQSRNALFAPGSHIRDFSIEFWLYPLNMENGEQILSWISSRSTPAGAAAAPYVFQRILCTVSKNRLQWSFMDFFTFPDDTARFNITITGTSPVIPKSWSHHLIRFDSVTGLLEYLVNGKTEVIEYSSSTRHEGGEVYTPVVGSGGGFTLGGHFMGIIDEFKIYNAWVNDPETQKYPARGGRIETRAIDLGEGNSSVVKVEASGGRTSPAGKRVNTEPGLAGFKPGNEFRENGRFRFADDSELQFFIRTSDNPYAWNESVWHSFIPGTDLSGTIQGRYVQLAVDFYPSADGETSPYLEGIQITYIPNEPPLPPSSLVAAAADGGVLLRWKSSPNTDTAGYLVYYGDRRDEYFGGDAVQGASPIDVGKSTTFFIEGLNNGTLYYFRVAAYNRPDSGSGAASSGAASSVYHAGEFSREVTARPLQGLTAGP